METLSYTIQYIDGEDKGLCVEQVGEFENIEDLQMWAASFKGDYKIISIEQ